MESLPRMPKPTVFIRMKVVRFLPPWEYLALSGDIFEDPNWNDVTGI